MASTNKTPGLELSQFLATDKPSWLGDYNSDMAKIDTGYTSIKAEAEGAAGDATNAKNIALTAVATANSASSAVSDLNTDVDGWVTYMFPNPNVSKFTSYSLGAKYNLKLKLLSLMGSLDSNAPLNTNEVLFVLPQVIRPKGIVYLYAPGYIATSGANPNSGISVYLDSTTGNGVLNSATTTENNFRIATFLTMSDWFDT